MKSSPDVELSTRTNAEFARKEITTRQAHVAPITDRITIFPFLFFAHLLAVATKGLFRKYLNQ
jgi:hypothetical protein